MSEEEIKPSEAEAKPSETEVKPKAEAKPAPIVEAGKSSKWLTEQGFDHEFLGRDASGVEMIKVEPDLLIPFCAALHAEGFNYLQCQGGYDTGPGGDLVSFYHLIKCGDDADRPDEVRLKVFLPRENPRVPSVFWIWKAADWQERETFDMYGIIYEGHPNLKRLLMPEDWVGYPLRKDYISQDFYELQDAY